MSDIEDLDLIKSFLVPRGGSPTPESVTAWEHFFHTHEPFIQTIVENCADRPVDEEDLFQAIWLALIADLPKLIYDPERGPLRAWVVVVARRTAMREARRLRRNRADALTAELAAVLRDPGPDPMTHCAREEERQRVRSILATVGAKLAEASRRIIALHWIDGQPVPEIAVALGLTEHRVRMRLQRALQKIRDLQGPRNTESRQK